MSSRILRSSSPPGKTRRQQSWQCGWGHNVNMGEPFLPNATDMGRQSYCNHFATLLASLSKTHCHIINVVAINSLEKPPTCVVQD